MNQLFKNQLWVLMLLVISCQSGPEKPGKTEAGKIYMGTWNARWHTTPEAFPDVMDSDLTMNGVFDFTEDSLGVTLYGYPGCLFSHDTLSNRSKWALSGDTLSLINEDNLPSITYQILSKEAQKVELVFLEDIFVTLTR